MHNAEFVQFETSDGLLLPGLFFEAQNSKKALISLHGNGSSSVFYKSEYELAESLNNKGISLLLFNNRGAHIIKKFTVKDGEGEKRISQGTAFERIAECVQDIDAAAGFLKSRSYETLHLTGQSTGANKICVYNHYKPTNDFTSYILTAGGDDTGLYYEMLGEELWMRLLKTAKEKKEDGKEDEIIPQLLPEIMSYRGYLDVAHPDGDYNCFPFSEVLNNRNLSEKKLFRYFSEIVKPAHVVYGENDEYAWGDAPKCVEILKKHRPDITYKIIKDADHGFNGKKEELANIIVDFLEKQ